MSSPRRFFIPTSPFCHFHLIVFIFVILIPSIIPSHQCSVARHPPPQWGMSCVCVCVCMFLYVLLILSFSARLEGRPRSLSLSLSPLSPFLLLPLSPSLRFPPLYFLPSIYLPISPASLPCQSHIVIVLFRRYSRSKHVIFSSSESSMILKITPSRSRFLRATFYIEISVLELPQPQVANSDFVSI